MLGAIENKIKEMKRNKCQTDNPGDNYTLCPWNGDISNRYLPTETELYAQVIYLNRGSVKIESLQDEIEYSIEKKLEIQNTTNGSGELISRYVSVPSTYILRYKKNSYTFEESKTELDKKLQMSSNTFLLTAESSLSMQDLPCNKLSSTQ